MAKTAQPAKSAPAKKDGKGKKDPAARFPKILKKRNQTPKGERRGMRLMLTENVEHLGKQGEVVEVRAGYGRNYLLPYGLATYVTAETQRRIEKYRAKLEAIRIARVAELKMLARELEKISVTIEANATEEGHLYGSVTAHDIATAIGKEKQTIDESCIRLEGAIKELGMYQVPVSLGDDVATEIKVWVVPTGGAKPA